MTDLTLPIHRDEGHGPVLVFLHGLLVDGELWRDVVPLLSDRFRCVVLDLPLGSHRTPMPPATDLTPPGIARLIAATLAAGDLQDVTVVANDTGGALAQLLVTRHPERIARLVLTNCDLFEDFLPRAFMPLVIVGRQPGAPWLMSQLLRSARFRRSPLGFGALTHRPIADELLERWTAPLSASAGVRRDLRAVLAGVDRRLTLDAAERLRSFSRPVLLAWAREDRFFRAGQAERLAAMLPDARIEDIADSLTFTPLDAPARLAQLVGDFAAPAAR